MLKKYKSINPQIKIETKKELDENIIIKSTKKHKKGIVKKIISDSYIIKLDKNSSDNISPRTYGQIRNGAVTHKDSFGTISSRTYGSIRNGFGEGIVQACTNNSSIVALCADLKDSLKLTEFEKLYPNNYYEFGICEQNMISAAAGMTINNKIPFVVSYAAFNPGRNWDQLRVSVCYSNSNVKVIGGHAGLTTGPDGATHQALEDIAITRTLPNLIVIIPCDEAQAKKATIAAAKHKGPAYIRLTREKSLNITNENTGFEIGKAQVLDKGDDLTIIATGITLQFALEAREKLKEQNIAASVINLHTIKPLDEKTILEYVKKTKAIITIEEHQIMGGMGSAICEFLSKKYPVPIELIGMNNCFGESGEGYELLEKYNISVDEIIKRAKIILKRK